MSRRNIKQKKVRLHFARSKSLKVLPEWAIHSDKVKETVIFASANGIEPNSKGWIYMRNIEHTHPHYSWKKFTIREKNKYMKALLFFVNQEREIVWAFNDHESTSGK